MGLADKALPIKEKGQVINFPTNSEKPLAPWYLMYLDFLLSYTAHIFESIAVPFLSLQVFCFYFLYFFYTSNKEDYIVS